MIAAQWGSVWLRGEGVWLSEREKERRRLHGGGGGASLGLANCGLYSFNQTLQQGCRHLAEMCSLLIALSSLVLYVCSNKPNKSHP